MQSESKFVLQSFFLVAVHAALITIGCSGQSNSATHEKPRSADAATVRDNRSRAPETPSNSVHANSPAEDMTANPVELSVERNLDRSMTDMIRRVDSNADEWQVEQFNDAAMKCLHQLEDHWKKNNPTAADPSWVADDFQCTPLRPHRLQTTFKDKAMTVQVGQQSAEEPAELSASGQRKTHNTLGTALSELHRALRTTSNAQATVHCKIVRVEMKEGDDVTTGVLYHASGKSSDGIVEQHATWQMDWINSNSVDALKLKRIALVEYEEIQSVSNGAGLFADCTESIFQNEPSFRRQLIYGVDRWRRDFEASLDPDLTGHQGLAVADFNGDGLADLYVCQQGGLPNRLMLQQPNGTVVDGSSAAGVDFLDLCTSALGLDLDNDGDKDLVVANGTSVVILENNGNCTFQQKGKHELNATIHSLCGADYDLDGLVDLYACGYSPGESIWRAGESLGAPVPYYDANNGGPNSLLKNDGELRFRNVTHDVGLEQNNRRFSFAASWEDFDNDGDSDLYVANDFGRNNLYRNDAGRFVDVAAESQVEDMATGMSVSWADYDNDGWMDAYIGNMFSSAGNRIAFQRQFLPQANQETQKEARRLARGNSLFRGGPDGRFQDVSETAAVTRGRWAWASVFTDFNNDGFEDIVVANGFITHRDSSDL